LFITINTRGFPELSYKAMRSYIDIVDSIKASSMTKLDGLIYHRKKAAKIKDLFTFWLNFYGDVGIIIISVSTN